MLEQAAAKGEPSALRELADVYKGGSGVPADNAKVADLVLRALAASEWGILDDLPAYPPSAIRALQTRLKAAGHYKGAVDGLFTPEFAAALGARVDVIRSASR